MTIINSHNYEFLLVTINHELNMNILTINLNIFLAKKMFENLTLMGWIRQNMG